MPFLHEAAAVSFQPQSYTRAEGRRLSAVPSHPLGRRDWWEGPLHTTAEQLGHPGLCTDATWCLGPQPGCHQLAWQQDVQAEPHPGPHQPATLRCPGLLSAHTSVLDPHPTPALSHFSAPYILVRRIPSLGSLWPCGFPPQCPTHGVTQCLSSFQHLA